MSEGDESSTNYINATFLHVRKYLRLFLLAQESNDASMSMLILAINLLIIKFYVDCILKLKLTENFIVTNTPS